MNRKAISIFGAASIALSALAIGGAFGANTSGAVTEPAAPPYVSWTATSDRWTVPAGTPVTFTFTALASSKTYDDVQMFGSATNSTNAPGNSGDCTIGLTSSDQVATAPADGETFCDLPAFPNGGTHYQWHETVYPNAAGNVQGRACIVIFPYANTGQPVQTCSTTLTVHAVTGSGFSQYPVTWTPGS
jgi:hypothetical protein